MPLQAHILPWAGYAVRHIPYTPGKSYDIYDFRSCSRSTENRWNIAGESTLYLAKEKNVALAEYVQHFKIDRTPQLAAQTYRRQVVRFKVELDYVLDLTNSQVWAELSLEAAPDCFKDKNIARSIANFIRFATLTQAIIVPSIAFLDNLEQWCLVVFLEKLPSDTRKFLPAVEPDGFFQIS